MKHIYYKNDFAVEITLLNASGEVVSPPEWQWHIEFTDGRRKYICSVDNGNAKVVGNTIMCYIDNHKFCCGEIGYKFVQAIPDLNYLDGFQNLITPKALPIELWEQESDNDVNIQSSVVPAYVVYDAYMTAKANGYTGTAEEFYDALNHIVDINKKEADRVEAESNRVTAEQQRVENFIAMESALTTATSKANTATTKAEEASKRADNSATAASQARVQATIAANGANAAAAQATQAMEKTNEATELAKTATANANASAVNAGNAATEANEATKRANDATEKAKTATTSAEQSAERANTAADNADVATSNATQATKRANDISADLEAKREADYWRGDKGEKGDDGVSPTVTTSKTGKVTTIEITDANGVHTATVNDGESVEVVQSTGTSTTAVMSQKAVSEAINKLKNAGYLYAGIATPITNLGTPDGPVFYIANGKGTYTNFGGLEVTEDDVVILYYDTVWHKVSTGIASNGKLIELERGIYGKKDEDYKSGIKGSVTITSEIGSRAVIEIVSDDIWFYNYIPILKGAHIVLKTQGGSTYRAYYLLGNNDILLETADTSLTGYRTYIIDAEENGKIITNCNPAGGSYSLTISYPQESLKDIVVSHNQKIEVLETDTSTLKESQESIEKIVIGSTNKDYTSELKAGSFKGYAIGSVHDCKVLPDTSANPWKYVDIQTNEGDEFEFALRGGPTYPAVSILDKNNVVIDIEVMSSYTIIKKTMPTGAKRILINDDPSKGTASIIKLAKKGLKEKVEILNDKIEKIEEDSIVNHNKDIAHIIQSSSAFIGNQQEGTSGIKTQHKYLTILHGSDFHNDGIRFGRLVDMLNYYNVFDCAVLTGDFCKDSYVDNGFENTFVSHYQRANKPLLYSIGNHDVGVEKYVYSFGGKVNSIDNCNERFINPYTTYFGLTKGNGGYFYKDFEQFKIRVISINEYEMPRVIDTDTKYKYDLWYRYLSQTQVNWLINSLNVEAGWSVIIAMHQLPNALTVYDNKFKSSYNATSGDYKDSQGNLLVELIDAYISKVALNKTYVNTIGAPSSDIPDVTVNVDFSNYNGTFICYLNGHTHGDMIGEVTSAVNKQLNLNITSGGCIYKSYYDDIMRVDGTKSQDCFNMVVFDTDKHKVRILRIGANTTLNMTYRDMESILYVE